ncbi:MAG: ABC transporter permease [Parvibaculum sp.]
MAGWVNLQIAIAHLVHRTRQTLVSVLGVALGVGFFIATSAMMQGSEQDLTNRLVDSQPHVTIKDEFRTPSVQPIFTQFPEGAIELKGVKPRERLRGIKSYKAKVDEIELQPGFVASPVLTGQAIVRFGGKDRSVSILGVDPDKEVLLTTIEDDMIEGSMAALKTVSDGIVIGTGLSRRLQLQVGDLASVVSPTGHVMHMKIAGLFRAGNILLDEGQAYVLLKDAQVLMGKPNIADQIRVRLPDPDMAPQIAEKYEARWAYRSESWQEVNEDFLSLFVVRNAILYSIVSAIMVVASFGIFNIISTVVMEKRRDIAILMSMGFRAGDIRQIFLLQGIALGLIGMLLGWGVGYLLVEALGSLRFELEGFYEDSTLPLDRGFYQYLIGAVFALVSSIVAAWIPAYRASQVRPVEIIRGAA